MQHPSEFAFSFSVTSTGTSADFEFAAHHVRIRNSGRAPLYFRLRQGAASPGDTAVAPGEVFTLSQVRCGGVSLTSTAPTVASVSAWGD